MLALGRRLGDFEIVRLLGKGGMGEVYEARQLNPARSVALKVLAPWLSSNDEALARFWREAAVPAQLDHPGIVRIISTGRTDDGTAYYTMHLVRGISLSALIKKSTETLLSTAAFLTTPPADTPASGQNGIHSPSAGVECPVGEPPPGVMEAYRSDRYGFVARIGAKAARALADAHSRGYLHRDIKPSNLMIDHHDQLYLVDFGLTKALDPGAGATQAGVIRGTPWYMSPEQARGEQVDRRSDIYSLGVTLYELATEGKGPFTANRENSGAVIQQVKAGLRCPLRDLAPVIPPRLERIILKAMHYKPRKRYQDVRELADALESCGGGSQRISTLTSSSHTPIWRRRVAAFIGGLLVLAGLVLGILAATRDPAKQESADANKNVLVAANLNPDRPRATEEAKESPSNLLETALPQILRERVLRNKISLFTDDFKPIYYRRMHGQGVYHSRPDLLDLQTVPVEGWMLIALDDDPKRHWFEFSVELAQFPGAASGMHALGVFFGYRADAPKPDPTQRFFTVELDEGDSPFGAVKVGSARIAIPGEGERGGSLDQFTALVKGPPITLPSREQWRKLTIRVVDDRITITADKAPPLELEMSKLRQLDPQIADKLNPRGAVGIWVRNGVGFFRNATTTALPSEK